MRTAAMLGALLHAGCASSLPPERAGPTPTPAPWAAPLPAFGDVAPGSTYVGSATCGGCHSEAHRVWVDSRHAHALETLTAVEADFNPSCFRCHTVGAGHPSGFVNASQTPQLQHVGCESCHGPGSKHAAAPAAPFGTLARDNSACVGCHSIDNSPEFDWSSYWPAVAHGQ